MQERRYDIDWLRVLAMMMVFLFHCARFFGGGGWHLKNPGEERFIANLFIGLLDLWIMPLFFLLSGAGSWYALKSRNAGQYPKKSLSGFYRIIRNGWNQIRKRVKRLIFRRLAFERLAFCRLAS
jgi:surface polysaccharide O-acyltransferase-like enzyme